jgi:hypothetical protein
MNKNKPELSVKQSELPMVVSMTWKSRAISKHHAMNKHRYNIGLFWFQAIGGFCGAIFKKYGAPSWVYKTYPQLIHLSNNKHYDLNYRVQLSRILQNKSQYNFHLLLKTNATIGNVATEPHTHIQNIFLHSRQQTGTQSIANIYPGGINHYSYASVPHTDREPHTSYWATDLIFKTNPFLQNNYFYRTNRSDRSYGSYKTMSLSHPVTQFRKTSTANTHSTGMINPVHAPAPHTNTTPPTHTQNITHQSPQSRTQTFTQPITNTHRMGMINHAHTPDPHTDTVSHTHTQNITHQSPKSHTQTFTQPKTNTHRMGMIHHAHASFPHSDTAHHNHSHATLGHADSEHPTPTQNYFLHSTQQTGTQSIANSHHRGMIQHNHAEVLNAFTKSQPFSHNATFNRSYRTAKTIPIYHQVFQRFSSDTGTPSQSFSSADETHISFHHPTSQVQFNAPSLIHTIPDTVHHQEVSQLIEKQKKSIIKEVMKKDTPPQKSSPNKESVIDIDGLTDRIYNKLERKIRREKEMRGR